MKISDRLTALAVPLIAIIVALLIGAVLMELSGLSSIHAYSEMWNGIFGSKRNFAEVLLKATPLILIGAGLCISFRCGVWNIGAEGQFYMGGVASTYVALQLGGVPSWISIPLVMMSGALAGAFWGGIAGYLKARFSASEIVTTIMLNYIAIIFTSYLVTGPLMEAGGMFPQSDRFPKSTELPRILSGTRLHIGILIAVVLAVISWYLISQSRRGFSMRAVGASNDAARYAGINVNRNIIIAISHSGALAGLAGSIELIGLTKRLFQTISPGYGFEGIAVALLANNNPLGAIFSGLLFGALRSGSEIMQIAANVPSVLIFIIQGLVIISIVTLGVLRLRRKAKQET